MRRRYFAHVEGSSTEGYSAYFPDLNGCVTAGRTIEEVNDNAHEALALHLRGMIEDGDEIPPAAQFTNATNLEGLAAVLEVIVTIDSRLRNGTD